MAVRVSRVEQAAATEWRLLEAAYRVFMRLGFQATTLDAVALEAGFTKGAVYSRFGSKAELFLALLRCRAAQRARDLRAGAIGPKGIPVDATGRLWGDAIRDDLAWMLLVIEFRVYAARVPELNARYAAIHELVHTAAVDVLAARTRASGIRLRVSVAEAAHALLALFNGLVLERAADPAAVPEATIARLAGSLIDGLSEPAATRRRSAR